jgi:hypothetical protein
MKRLGRKTTPRVINGKVQRKNRSAPTPNYYNTPQELPVIDRQRPGRGYRHVLKKKDIVGFISILPDWDELSKGLDAIFLAPAEENTDGWHRPGIVAVCAWEREFWCEADREFYKQHRDLLKRLGVPCRMSSPCCYELRWEEPTIRAYQLLHILLHELGHHHDRMTTRSQCDIARGEPYAEAYARAYEKTIWDRYFEVFGLD